MGRTTWSDVPPVIHREVERLLGGPVVEAVSQAAGWSPGSADRVVTAAGTRAFVKTLSRTRNPDGVGMHRREAEVLAAMPTSVQAPRLLGSLDVTVDEDEWVALVIEDVAGRHPAGDEDTAAVLDALDSLPVATGTLAGLPRASAELQHDAGAWDRMISAGVPEVVPEHIRDRAAELAEAGRVAADLVDGEHLVHLDCRADNLLVDGQGVVWVLDWPWAGVGAHWLDGVTYLLDLLVRGEDADVEQHLATHPLFAGLAPSTVDAVLAMLAGLFFASASRPAPPSMPTIRDFQRREGIVAAEWFLRRRR